MHHRCFIGSVVCLLTLCVPGLSARGQTSPTPQALPLSQSWGTANFTSLPTGFAAWNGLNGGSITTQAQAESSAPTGNATVTGSAPTSGGAGGCYGFAVSGNARFGILTSSNATNGVDQLAMAISTTGLTNVSVSYDLINTIANARTIGTACQYRVGTSGSWTTITGTGNPYTQSGGTAGTVTHAAIALPAAANNQANVQIRWAVWRGTEGGSSSGFAIDNIVVTGSGTGGPTVSGVSASGTSFTAGDSATITVQLDAAPAAGTPATISVSSGAFAAPVNVTISNPATSGTANVTMLNAGTWTAAATALTGCSGAAVSASFTVAQGPVAPTVNAGVDRTVMLSTTGTAVLWMTGATVDDANGLTGVTYAWTPETAAGITGWSNRTGSVTATTSPASASVTFTATGTYMLTLTAIDPTARSASDSVSITVVPYTAVSPYDPPADYYATVTGNVSTLKTELHRIIASNYWVCRTGPGGAFVPTGTGHYRRSYDDAREGLQVTDADPDRAGYIIGAYNGQSMPGTWDSGATWNREHRWPQSIGNDSGPGYSDLFQLTPCSSSVNGSRGNKPYGTPTATGTYGLVGSYYYPGDADRPSLPDLGNDTGDVARMGFYMAVRYDGSDANDLELADGPNGSTQLGDRAAMLVWHYRDLPSTFERRRNHLIFSQNDNPQHYQGNRNPFIDHPEYVWAIFGTSLNDSKLYVGSSVPADGQSTMNVDFGSMLVGAATPAPQSVTLNKAGATPTCYAVTASGAATCDVSGRNNTFDYNAGSRSMTVGLTPAATATVGASSGVIRIDNLDLTTAGAGQGAADGDDTFVASARILAHANASFDVAADQNTLTIDLGNVFVGTGVKTREFSIANLEATAGFTAGLNLTGIAAAGDTSTISTDLAAFINLPAGTARTFTVSFNPTALGSFQATYTLAVADQALPGSQAGTSLVLTVTARVVPTIRPDFNDDGFVNQVDLDRFCECSSGPAVAFPEGCIRADLDDDGDVDTSDFGIFQRCWSGSLNADVNCLN